MRRVLRRDAAQPAVADGRARRALRPLSRPPLNGSIVGQTSMATPIGTFVEVSLPEGEWHRVDTPTATTLVRSGDFAECDGKVEWASFKFWIERLDCDGRPSAEVTREVMRRRVAQGFPDEGVAQIDGLHAAKFIWSDGVAEVHSYFVVYRPGVVIEFSFASHRWPTGALKVPLDPAAEQLLAGVKWI
jgi:hypothetical protein